MIKDADEQPEKKENKVRSGRVLGTGNSVPMESYTLLVYEYVHHPVSSLNLVPLGFLWRLHHAGLIYHELCLQSLSPLWRTGDENSKLLIMA